MLQLIMATLQLSKGQAYETVTMIAMSHTLIYCTGIHHPPLGRLLTCTLAIQNGYLGCFRSSGTVLSVSKIIAEMTGI